MAKIQSKNYSYANNASGELINISTAQRQEKYFCPICGGAMIPHMGHIRRWHFVHKNTDICSYESYLHKLAKIKIRQAFLSSEFFFLSYDAKAICSCDCPFINSPKCEGAKSVKFNLRKYYDTCEIEASYNQYTADLLLTSSINPKTPPILIEIMVTHKCSDDKIRDGVRIIEIPIESEEQIDYIVKSCRLTAIRADHSYTFKDRITLYNFNKVETFDPTGSFDVFEDCFSRKNTIVLWLNQQGQFKTFNCHCYEAKKMLPPNVHYYITEIATPLKEIFQEFSKQGVIIRNCFLCKFSKHDWSGDRICVLYKKHKLPRKPSPCVAVSCPHYKEDIETPLNNLQSEQSLSTDYDNVIRHKYYYHINKDIL